MPSAEYLPQEECKNKGEALSAQGGMSVCLSSPASGLEGGELRILEEEVGGGQDYVSSE